MEKLESLGIGLIGTVRSNRKVINGEIKFGKDFNLLAKNCNIFIVTGWREKRDVLIVTNV